MEWIKSIFEKININAAIVALFITCVIAWGYTQAVIFIGVAIFLGFYLVLVLLFFAISYGKGKGLNVHMNNTRKSKKYPKLNKSICL